MVSKRTIRKIVKTITDGKTYSARVDGYYYDIEYYEPRDEIRATPRGRGHVATSTVMPDDLIYTHGGRVYRSAQELVWEVDEAMRAHFSSRPRDWEFETANGETLTYPVEETEFDNGVPAWVCPLCSRKRMYSGGCASGHVSIYPKKFKDVEKEMEEGDQ